MSSPGGMRGWSRGAKAGGPSSHTEAWREAIHKHAGMPAVRVCHTGGSDWRQYLLEDYSGRMFPWRLTHPAAHSLGLGRLFWAWHGYSLLEHPGEHLPGLVWPCLDIHFYTDLPTDYNPIQPCLEKGTKEPIKENYVKLILTKRK